MRVTIGDCATYSMQKKLIIFLIATIGFVALLVYYEQRRDSPWNSNVFFGAVPELQPSPLSARLWR